MDRLGDKGGSLHWVIVPLVRNLKLSLQNPRLCGCCISKSQKGWAGRRKQALQDTGGGGGGVGVGVSSEPNPTNEEWLSRCNENCPCDF